MPLPSETCRVCHETHLLMRNGQMSIHSNASGVRCEGSGDAEAHIKARQQAERELRQKERRARAANEDGKLRAYIGHMMNSGPVDRRIYGVKGGHTVSGGLSGHGKRS